MQFSLYFILVFQSNTKRLVCTIYIFNTIVSRDDDCTKQKQYSSFDMYGTVLYFQIFENSNYDCTVLVYRTYVSVTNFSLKQLRY